MCCVRQATTFVMFISNESFHVGAKWQGCSWLEGYATCATCTIKGDDCLLTQSRIVVGVWQAWVRRLGGQDGSHIRQWGLTGHGGSCRAQGTCHKGSGTKSLGPDLAVQLQGTGS